MGSVKIRGLLNYWNKILFLVLFFIIAFSVADVVSAESSTLYVNDSSGNDDWDGQYAEWISGTLSGPKKSIKNATGAVTEGGTINIADGVYTGENNTNININKNMTIIGQSREGTIINGTDSAQIFIIQSNADLIIQNLTIANGTTNSKGGAIYNDGSLTLYNTIFKGNTALLYGGAIYNKGDLAVIGSFFTNNRVTNPEGGGTNIDGFGTMFPSGGSIYNFGNLIVFNSTFTQSNQLGYGGAIYNTGNFTVLNCTFNNIAASGGGAIFNTAGTLNEPGNILYSTFTNNSASQGGAIHNEGYLDVIGSTFTDNTSGGGGAIYNQVNTVLAYYNRFYNNTEYDIYSYYGSVDAQYNWWTSNTSPAEKVFGNVNYSPFLILTISASPSAIKAGQTSKITANVYKDSLGTNHIGNADQFFSGSTVTFTTEEGIGISVDLPWENGQAITNYTASPGFSSVIIKAQDVQTVQITINSGTSTSPPAGPTKKISNNPAGGGADNDSYAAQISADGRYIVYDSDASNIVSGDTNGVSDIFLYDRVTKTTIRVNRGSKNAQAVGGDSYNPAISSDGRYIVYESDATNLVSGDTNENTDIFLYDRVLNKTIRVNRGPNNAQALNGGSYAPDISRDGRYIVYVSDATNLVSGDTNQQFDVFLYDRVLNKTIRANRGVNNAQATGGDSAEVQISSNGRYIVYSSDATNLVSGDSNENVDIFLYDRITNKTIRVNRGANNAQALNGGSYSPSISADGRYITYDSDATNLVSGDNNGLFDVFIYDRVLNKTIRANRGAGNAQTTGGDAYGVQISENGRYIVYTSDATNIVSGDNNGVSDIFLYDRVLNKTIRANRGPGNAQAINGNSFSPYLSADGKYIVYESEASNLVPEDNNGKIDVFLYPV